MNAPPKLTASSSQLVVYMSGLCSAIPAPTGHLSLLLTRFGKDDVITVEGSTLQADGKLIVNIPNIATMTPGRYKAELAGWPGCALCFPIEIGAQCVISSVSSEALPESCINCTTGPQASLIDLAISASFSSLMPVVGEQFSLNVVVTNIGQSVATNALVTIGFTYYGSNIQDPMTVTYQSGATGSAFFSLTGLMNGVTISSIPAGASATFHTFISGFIPSAVFVTTSVSVVAPDTESNTSNNNFNTSIQIT